MAEDNTQQSIIICSPQSYIAELNDHIEYAKKVAEENYTPYLPEQIESMVPDFIHRIEQEIQNENLHHPCLSIDLGQEYDVNGNMKHSNLKQVSVKFTPKAKHPYFISFLIEDKQGVKTATLQHILYGKQIQHLTKESTSHWILLKEFVNRNTTRINNMKKLNITKEQFNRSRYFQKKYGTLEYVSESGKVYKTSKGNLIRFNEVSRNDIIICGLDFSFRK